MKINLMIVFVFVTLLMMNTSCTDAQREKWNSLGNKHTVQLYSGGKLVREWTSTGKVSSEEGSDGYFFKDEECQCIVEVSGDVVITTIE